MTNIAQRLSMRLLSINELSQVLGIKVATIHHWVSERRIPFVKAGRLTKFDIEAINEWIKENTVSAEISLDTGRPFMLKYQLYNTM